VIIENDVKLDFSDVLIRPKRSTLTSRKEVDLYRKFKFRNYIPNFPENIQPEDYQGIPIMAANMDGVGTFEMADVLAERGLFTCLAKNYPKHELKSWIYEVGYAIKNHWAYSLGSSEQDLIKFDAVYSGTLDHDMINRSIKYVCIDVANGYTEKFVEFVAKFRQAYPNLVIIAGNVVTREMTEELILNGADIVKVGIGPGSVCTTRIKTGVGYPQLSAIIECADAAHGLGGHIIADGGCSVPGDVAKAFGAGADFVMLGGMLAGHQEGNGEPVFEDGEQTGVKFYGMSSKAANEKHSGGLKSYRSSEGREVVIPYKGVVSDTVQDILGGLRSACTYVGAAELKHLSKCTTFIRVNNQHNRVFEK
jgi:GMP reductase